MVGSKMVRPCDSEPQRLPQLQPAAVLLADEIGRVMPQHATPGGGGGGGGLGGGGGDEGGGGGGLGGDGGGGGDGARNSRIP